MKKILFDLDGTLLPMVQDEFVRCYYGLLLRKLEPFHVDGKKFINALNYGAYLMTLNDGTDTNEHVFWKGYKKLMGEPDEKMVEAINEFYENEFNEAIVSTKPDPLAKKIIELLKDRGYQIILATSPLFPRSATYNRIRWAGLQPYDFVTVTTYETSTSCKPSLLYYQQLIKDFDIDPSETMMIGNDVGEDMVASKLGFTTYLVTDYVENRAGVSYEPCLKGSLEDLYNYILDKVL